MVNIRAKLNPSPVFSAISSAALALFLILSFFLPNSFAETYVGGEITQNTTWALANSPYIVDNSVTVLQGVTLTIEPGVQVKFAGPYALTVNGSLIASGTESQLIIFTSNSQTPAPGDWQHIQFTDTSDDATCIISYAVVEYSYSGISTVSASPRIQNNIIQNNSTYGFYLDNSSPVITNNTIQNNSYVAIQCLYSSSPTITHNTIINNRYGIALDGGLINYPNPAINNNSIYNNSLYNLWAGIYDNGSSLTINAQNNWWGTIDPAAIMQKICDNSDNPQYPVVDFTPFLDGPNGNPINVNYISGSITANTTWTLAQSPYIVIGNVSINQGVTLTIEPGVQVKFAGPYALTVNGSLVASGTESQLITFTSNNQNPAPGNWQHIQFTDTSDDATCIISYAVVEYSTNGIYIQSSSPAITNNVIQNNTNFGIYCIYASSPVISNNTVTNNLYGIATDSYNEEYPNPAIHNNSILNNTNYDFLAWSASYHDRSSLTINAQNNWWGTIDPAAIRQKIYDNSDNPQYPVVDFTPFLDGPNGNPIDIIEITGVSVNPIPFNPSNNETVSINYTIDREADVIVTIQDLSYNAVKTIGPNHKLAGANTDAWDGRDEGGQIVADGVYTFTIVATNGIDLGAEYVPNYPGGAVAVSNFNVASNFNPYNNQACEISYTLSDTAHVILKAGKYADVGPFWVIVDRIAATGNNLDYWDGRDSNGEIVDFTDGVIAIWTQRLPQNPLIVRSNIALVAISSDPYAIIPSIGEISKITYHIDADSQVRLSVLGPDMALVKVLVDNETKPPGTYEVTWDGKSADNKVVHLLGNYTLKLEITPNGQNTITRYGNVTVR